MALKIDLKPGETIKIGNALVRLEEKSGQVARLSVEADKSIPVHRVQEQGGVVRIAAAQGIAPRK